MEITAWAQEHFQKSLSVKTVHYAIHKCRLKFYHTEMTPKYNKEDPRLSDKNGTKFLSQRFINWSQFIKYDRGSKGTNIVSVSMREIDTTDMKSI